MNARCSLKKPQPPLSENVSQAKYCLPRFALSFPDTRQAADFGGLHRHSIRPSSGCGRRTVQGKLGEEAPSTSAAVLASNGSRLSPKYPTLADATKRPKKITCPPELPLPYLQDLHGTPSGLSRGGHRCSDMSSNVRSHLGVRRSHQLLGAAVLSVC